MRPATSRMSRTSKTAGDTFCVRSIRARDLSSPGNLNSVHPVALAERHERGQADDEVVVFSQVRDERAR